MSRRVLLVCTGCDTSAAVAHALIERFGKIDVIEEAPEARSVFLRRRLRRLGLVAVVGQLAFMALILPVLRRRAERRIRAIKDGTGFSFEWPPKDCRIRRVASINDDEAHAAIKSAGPEVCVINGTRILSGRTLAALGCPAINIHCGITPRYRGVHGGYWALASGDPDHCGVTVHLVSTGVDTGDLLVQRPVARTADDSFATYPYLQYAAALPELPEQVALALDGRLTPTPGTGPSAQWYHPTLWSYLLTGLKRGVW